MSKNWWFWWNWDFGKIGKICVFFLVKLVKFVIFGKIVTDPSWSCFPSFWAAILGDWVPFCSFPSWRRPCRCCGFSCWRPNSRCRRDAARHRRLCGGWSTSASRPASAAGSSADGTRAGGCTGSWTNWPTAAQAEIQMKYFNIYNI